MTDATIIETPAGVSARRAPRPTAHWASGVGLVVLAVGLLALSDMFAKTLSAGRGAHEIVFLRSLVGGVILAVFFLRGRAALSRRSGPLVARPGLQLLRGLMALGAIGLFFLGLAHLPFANAVALSVTAPFFMVFAGRLILGEPVKRSVWPLMALAALGCLFVVQPHRTEAPLWCYAAILGSSACYAMVAVLTRVASERDAPGTTALVGYVVVAAAGGLMAAGLGFGAPTMAELPVILGLGLTGALGMLVYSHAFDYAGVTQLAPWDNAVYLWALILGFAVFGETPDALALAGGCLLVLSGVLIHRFR